MCSSESDGTQHSSKKLGYLMRGFLPARKCLKTALHSSDEHAITTGCIRFRTGHCNKQHSCTQRWAAAQQLHTKEPQEALRPAQPLALWPLCRSCYTSPGRAPQSKVAQKRSMLEKRCKPGRGITTLVLQSYKHLLAFTIAHWQRGSYRNLKYPPRLRCPLPDHEFIILIRH